MLGPADHVRLVGGGSDPIELSGGVILGCPAPSAVDGDIRSSVIGVDHPFGIVWGDPQIVVVPVRHGNRTIEALPSVIRPVERGVQDVHTVLVHGICIDSTVVESPLTELPLVVGAGPRVSSVVGPKDPSLLVFDDGIHAVGIHRRHGNADLSYDTLLGQTRISGDLLPGLSPIHAPEEPTPRASG